MCGILIFSQKQVVISLLKAKDAQEILGDDYGNIYVYSKKDLSLTKYDSLGKQTGRLMMTFPYKIQSVSNPLNIVLFSENAQEIKFLDQNLNEIQKINLSPNFGFVTAAYAEDLQFAWLLDDSSKTLIQYNFRTNAVINSFPFNISLTSLKDFVVYNNRIFILRENRFEVYNTSAKLLYSTAVDNARKLRRHNDDLLIFTGSSISDFDGQNLLKIFENPDAKIVDKNSSGFLALIGDKLYLYNLK